MKTIEKFTELALKAKDGRSFQIEVNTNNWPERWFFTQLEVGKARIIYGMSQHKDVLVPRIGLKPSLIAIVADETVYLVNKIIEFTYDLSSETSLPSAKLLENERAEQLEKAKTKLFPAWLEKIEPRLRVDGYAAYASKVNFNEARNRVIMGRSKLDKNLACDAELSVDDFILTLAGFKTVEEFVMEYLNDSTVINRYSFLKGDELEVQKLVSSDSIAKPYERAIGAGLAKVAGAKTVTVEIANEDQVGSGKMEYSRLVSILLENRTIDYFDFANSTAGKKMFVKLFGDKLYPSLTTANISKIFYGKQTLYEKKEATT